MKTITYTDKAELSAKGLTEIFGTKEENEKIEKTLIMEKVYNNFSDKFGNKYGFADYASFSTFWFNLSRKNAMNFFPDNFKELQRAATTSKEALQKVLPKK